MEEEGKQQYYMPNLFMSQLNLLFQHLFFRNTINTSLNNVIGTQQCNTCSLLTAVSRCSELSVTQPASFSGIILAAEPRSSVASLAVDVIRPNNEGAIFFTAATSVHCYFTADDGDQDEYCYVASLTNSYKSDTSRQFPK
jgi:hypothetical protein